MPLTVAVLVELVNARPGGSKPEVIDQVYGDLPPETEQFAEYFVPTVAGPVEESHVMEIGRVIVPAKDSDASKAAALPYITRTV